MVGKPERAWLTFLADHLEHKIQNTDFAWWELTISAPKVVAVAFGLATLLWVTCLLWWRLG